MKTISQFLSEALDGNALFNDKIKNIISLNNRAKHEVAVEEGLTLIGTKESLQLKKNIDQIPLDDIKKKMMSLAKKVMDSIHYKKFESAYPSQMKKVSKGIDKLNGQDFKNLDKLEKNINSLIGKLVRSNLHKEKGFVEAINKIIKGLSVK